MRKVRGPIALLIVLGVAASCSVPRLDELHPRALAQTSFLYAADGSLITTAARAREPRRAQPRPDDERRSQRRRGDRGPPVLRPPRRRSRSDPPRGDQRPADRTHRRGRFDHHPAAGEEPLHGRPAELPAEARRSGPRLADGEPAHEATDPDRVPEHRVLRRGGVRRPGRRADLLRHRRRRPHARAVGDAGRAHHRAEPLRSVRPTSIGARTPQRRPALDAAAGPDPASAPARRPAGEDHAPRPTPPATATRTRTSSTTSSSGSCRTRRSARPTTTGTGCCSPAASGSRRRSTRRAVRRTGRRLERAGLPQRPRRGSHGARSAHRYGPRDGRRQRRPLLGQRRRRPRQPRHGDGWLGPPDRVGLQGVRARRGARARHLARHRLLGAGVDRHPAARRRRPGTSRTPRATATAR